MAAAALRVSAVPDALPPPLQRTRGTARVIVRADGGQTRLAGLYQESAAKIRLPHTHAPHLEAVLMNTAGGLTDGDRLDWQAEAGAGTHLVMTTPACERIYRSRGGDAEIAVTLDVGAGARLDWLPQETILFDGARLARRLDVTLAPDARLLAVEAVLLGRTAMGEDASSARLSDSWRVRVGDRLVHAEETRLAADTTERDSLALLAGNLAFAAILYVGPDAERQRDAVRELPEQQGVAMSASDNRLVVRALAPTGLALRRAIIPIIARLSGAGSLPRLWSF